MRIYGGHDYYDCVLGYGADPTVVLVRKNEAIDPKLVNTPQSINLDLYEDHHRLRFNGYGSSYMKRIYVVFCDKVYFGVEITRDLVPLYFWQADKLCAWVASQKGMELKASHSYWGDWKKKHRVEDYFEVISAPADLREFMIANRYAIVLKKEVAGRHEPECWMNPHGLKKLGFAKALDPYTAYQELSMWVGGVLAGESPKMVRITDNKVLIENHGFDNVFSFRGPRIK